MKPMTDDELDLILDRCEAATPGPWKSFIEGRDHTSGSNVIKTAGGDIEFYGPTVVADQDFIASARQDIPRLIAEIRRLKKIISSGDH